MKNEEVESIVKSIIDSAFRVHSELGPGMLEKTYEICLKLELEMRGHDASRQNRLPIIYRNVVIEDAYRVDLIVDSAVIVETKAVGKLIPVHRSQLLSYLKMSGMKVGLLINFDVPRLKGNIRRVVNCL